MLYAVCINVPMSHLKSANVGHKFSADYNGCIMHIWHCITCTACNRCSVFTKTCEAFAFFV